MGYSDFRKISSFFYFHVSIGFPLFPSQKGMISYCAEVDILNDRTVTVWDKTFLESCFLFLRCGVKIF